MAVTEFTGELDNPGVPQGTVEEFTGELDTTPAAVRAAGLATRAVAKGVASPITLAGDAYAGLTNLAIMGINKIAGSGIPPVETTSAALDRSLTSLGLPEPGTPDERVLSAVAEGAAGAGGFMLAGKGVQALSSAFPNLAELGATLLAAPKTQVLSAAAAGGAAQAVQESGGGPLAQLGVSLIAGAVPFAGPAAIAATARGAIRGGEAGRQAMTEAMEPYARQGVEPSVGDVTTGRTRSFEGMLSQSAGSADVMKAQREKQLADTSARVDALADNISKVTDPAAAGMEIKRGINNFAARYKETAGKLQNELDTLIPSDTPVQPTATMDALNSVLKPTPGAEAVYEGFLANPRLAALRSQLDESYMTWAAHPGSIPYAALKNLRTRVGELMDSDALVGEVSNGALRKLYGALTDDMREAARIAGGGSTRYSQNPVLALWEKNRRFVRQAHARMEDVLEPLIRKGVPEKIYTAATNADMRKGATQIRLLMRSLSDPQQRAITSVFVRRMGLPQADGEWQFSTFLTNWRALSPEAKAELFNRKQYGSLRANLDDIADIAERAVESAKRKPGEGAAVTTQKAATAAAVLVATGNTAWAAAVLGLVAGMRGASHMMTNPDFVRWVSQATKMPASAAPTQLGNLYRISRSWNDEDKADVEQMIKKAEDALYGPSKGPLTIEINKAAND